MRAPVRSTLDYALRHSPAQAYFRRRAAGRLAVLAYHGVDDRDTFAHQLDHLVRVARPVSLDDVIAAAYGRRPLEPRSVLITFDDGHRSVLDNARPELTMRGIPAVAFLIAGSIDSDEPFWWVEVEQLVAAGAGVGGVPADVAAGPPAVWVRWLKTVDDRVRRTVIDRLRMSASRPADRMPQLRGEELRTLETAGIRVGNHTLTHPCLDRCDTEAVRREIRDAHAVLSAALGRPPSAFAYPNGNWDGRAEVELEAAGYDVGFLFDHRLSAAPQAAPLRISRLRVSDTTPTDRFAAILSGLHPAVHHARGGR